MPSKSKKQHRFFEVIAHSPEFAKKAGVPQKVGKDFADADKAEGKFKPERTALTKDFKHMNHGGKSVTHEDVHRGFTKRPI